MPQVKRSLSTLTSVFVQWQEGEKGDLEITGYKLFMIELATGNQKLVYDGTQNTGVKSYLVEGLQTGHYYSFFVKTINYNQESE